MKVKSLSLWAMAMVTTATLAGCTSPHSPKEAYIDASKQMEQSTSYEKDSSFDLSYEHKGEKTDEKNMWLELLNHSHVETKSMVDKNMNGTETTVSLTSREAFLPIDAKISFFTDEKKNKVYVDADGLLKALSNFTAVPQGMEGKLIEIDGTKNQEAAQSPLMLLLKADNSAVLTALDESKFTRSDVSEEEKREKIRDKITVKLEDKEIKELLENVLLTQANKEEKDEMQKKLDSLSFKSVMFTAYLNRKGEFVKETADINWSATVDKAVDTYKVELESTYNNINKAVEFTVKPDGSNVITLEKFFAPQVLPNKEEKSQSN